MTKAAKMWTVRLTILSILVAGFFFIKNELDEFNTYPTGTPLNEDSLKFNSEEWKREREYYEAIRPYMLKDLMTNVLTIGMDSTTVKDLLGENLGPHDSRWWDYRLGVYREMEASYLQIEFDDKGKLKRVEIIDR
jgi:hypothetical protein